MPDLGYYLPKLATLLHHFLPVLINDNKELTVMEDFVSLGYSAEDLAAMSEEKFRELYERALRPINQIALNIGFETWKYL